jgi:hypothetical protein
MSLELKTDIEKQIHDKIRGKVARIGAAVDELIDYRDCRVTDINMIDGGFGQVRKLDGIRSIRHIWKTAKRYAKQEVMHALHGEKICRDRKTVILDMHTASEHPELSHKFDACISSNVLEHSFNPILLLLNFYYVTKKDGYQYHAIPHCRYIYDKLRPPTKIEHLIEDFTNKTDKNDTTHNREYIELAVNKNPGYPKKFHETYPVAYPVMHFHVFDENNTRELFGLMFEEVTNDILLEPKFSDNVVIFKNRLNDDFIDKHGKTIKEYSENLLRN